jgi:hypothetical protein
VPAWLIAGLVVAAVVLIAAWAETRANIIIGELKAIRENLDKLWADRAEEDIEEAEVGDPRHAGD